MTRTAVVILNYNGLQWLREFLPPVIQHSGGARIIVADNNSNDGSATAVAKEFPQVELIRIPVNKGFCGGYNFALAQVDSEYFVLLNSDVLVTAGWIDPVIRLMDQDPQIGAVQPKILSYHRRDEFEYAGAAGGFVDALGYPFCRGRIFNTLEKDKGQYNDTRPVFWATGACLFIRSGLFTQMGGLDEDFFAHMEEIDLCWRLNRAGFGVYYQGESHVYHVGGGTLSASNPRKTYYNFKNGLSLIYKNMRTAQLAWKFPLRVVLDWVAALKFLAEGSPADFAAVLKAHVHFFLGLRREVGKRRSLARQFPFATAANYRGLIVWDYFVRKKRTFGQLGR